MRRRSLIQDSTLVLSCWYSLYFVEALARADPLPLDKPKSPLTDEFDALVYSNLDYWHVPGISVAVVDGNETFSKVSQCLQSA